MILLTHKSETLFHGSIVREQARVSQQKLSANNSCLYMSDQHACCSRTTPESLATQAKPHVNSWPLPQPRASQECNNWLTLSDALARCAHTITFWRAYLYFLLILTRHSVYLPARLHLCSCKTVAYCTSVAITCLQVATAVNMKQLKLCNTHQQRAIFALQYLSNANEFWSITCYCYLFQPQKHHTCTRKWTKFFAPCPP